MKANRKFVESDEAVSPVIAVILMVAITVVLAATVFVLVSDIGSNTAKNAPQMGWADDEAADSFSVTQAPTQIFWKDFKIKVAGSNTILVAWNQDATGTATESCTLTTSYQAMTACPSGAHASKMPVAAGTDVVNGGDFFQFCTTTAAPGVITPVQVTILHSTSNAISHEFSFSTIATC